MKLNELHSQLIDATALAGLLAETLTYFRRVHADDGDKPCCAAASALLHRELERLRDAVEEAANAT